MFDRYDEIMKFFDIYLLNRIVNNDFEIKGSIQTLRSIIKQFFSVDLPNLLDDDRQLIHSSVKKCLDAKRESQISYNVFYSKRKRIFNDKSLELQDAKIEMDQKMFEYTAAKIELKKTCEFYARALCIAIYNGPIDLELLEYLQEIGYDGSYGNDNLKLIYRLYIENKEYRLKIVNLERTNTSLEESLHCLSDQKQVYISEIKKLKLEIKNLTDDLNHSNILVDYMKKENVQGRTFVKKQNVNTTGFHIYGTKKD